MQLLNKATNCCGGCFKAEIKFSIEDMHDLGVTFTEIDRMSDNAVLNKIPDMMLKLGYGSIAPKSDPKLDQTSGDGLFFLLTRAFDALKSRDNSRENSLAITNLEQAMMWFNKDRANRGEIPVNPTHVSMEDEE